MVENYEIITYREKYNDEFEQLLKDGNIEAKEISIGYNNPLIVSNILLCKMKCLENNLNIGTFKLPSSLGTSELKDCDLENKPNKGGNDESK